MERWEAGEVEKGGVVVTVAVVEDVIVEAVISTGGGEGNRSDIWEGREGEWRGKRRLKREREGGRTWTSRGNVGKGKAMGSTYTMCNIH